MAELIDIRRVQIDPENMIAHVRIAEGAPLMTSEDLEGTARVYRLLPHIVEHACLGDAGETFREAMGNTEMAHLLEHVTVELLAQTDLAGDMPAGRTWVDEVDERTYQIELACPDDVLVAAALSCGVWILDWAYSGGGDPEPDVDAIVAGLVQLVEGVGDEGEDLVVDYGIGVAEEEPLEEDDNLDEPEADEVAAKEDEPAVAEAGEEALAEPMVAEPAVEPEPEPLAQPAAAEPKPVVDERRSLWTPAPDVTSAFAVQPVEEHTEFDDEVDQIMATFESTAVFEALRLDEDGTPLTSGH